MPRSILRNAYPNPQDATDRPSAEAYDGGGGNTSRSVIVLVTKQTNGYGLADEAAEEQKRHAAKHHRHGERGHAGRRVVPRTRPTSATRRRGHGNMSARSTVASSGGTVNVVVGVGVPCAHTLSLCSLLHVTSQPLHARR